MRLIHRLAFAALFATGPVAAQSITISGTVRDTQAAGIAGVAVTVQRIDTPLGGGGIVGSATTDPQGAYAITFAGGCGVQCRITASAAGRVVSPDVRITESSATARDFVAALPATLEVRVETFDGATPVPGLRPFLAHRDPVQAPVIEDLGDGQWRFSRVFPAPLHVCAQADDDAFVGTCQDQQVMPFTNEFQGLADMLPVEGATQPVVLRLQRGATLTGILVDAFRAAPIASNSVQMVLFNFAGSASRSVGLRSDAEGRYRLPGLPPGAYRLQVSVREPYYTTMRYPGLECLQPEDCLPDSGSYVSVSGAAVVDNLGFELTPGAVLTGRITDQTSGAPLSGIEVRAYQVQTFLGPTRVASATSDADGRYAVAHVPLGFATRLGTANTAGYADAGWPSAACTTPECTGGTPITVQSGVSPTTHDFALAVGRAIGGTVSMPGVAPGALQGTIAIYRQAGTQMALVWTGPAVAGQAYLTRGLAAGTYFARANLGSACLVHAQQPCGGSFEPNPATATPIVLPEATGTYPGVDFTFPPDPLFGSGFE